jgi:SAM-dependent methyltransferase
MSASSPYDVAFDWDGAHGRLVALVRDYVEPGTVVDLGCGFAPHALVLEEAGFTYVGFDVDADAVAAVRARGHRAEVLDLGDVRGVIDALSAVSVDHEHAIVAVLAIDVIEHLVEPHILLAELSAWMHDHGVASFGVSVPNVAHLDVASKLVAGRWDVTPSGLLDHTHLRFFTDRSLTAMLASCGFSESARRDRPAVESDQWWALASVGTRWGSFVRSFRELHDSHGDTYQFIRLYAAAAPSQDRVPSLLSADRRRPSRFLSVLADPHSDDAALERWRRQLDAQTSTDWELVTARDARAPSAATDSPDTVIARMLDRASGAYVVFVEPGNEVDPNWVAALATIRSAGTILRVASQPDPGARFDNNDSTSIDELRDVAAPSATFAFPIEVFDRVRRPVDGLSRAASAFLDLFQFCGVASTTASMVSGRDATVLDHDALVRRIAELDAVPLLLPAGEIGRRVARSATLNAAEHRVAELNRHVAELEADNAWMAAELSIGPVRGLRKLLRRAPSRS